MAGPTGQTVWAAAQSLCANRKPDLRPRSRRSLAEALASVAAHATLTHVRATAAVCRRVLDVLAGRATSAGAWLDTSSLPAAALDGPALAVAAGIPLQPGQVTHAYDLRHGWVSAMLAAGVPPATVSMWAGHGVDAMLRTYTHAMPGVDAAARAAAARAMART